MRQFCYPQLSTKGALVVGSVCSLALGKITHKEQGVAYEIDLSAWTWHLVLDQSKLLNYLSLYGTSKDSLLSADVN